MTPQEWNMAARAATLDFPGQNICPCGAGDARLESRPYSMYLLKKVIQLREHAHPDHEKPFLEHLEDLRTMITRVVITLVISMIICFAFNKQLMEFFRHPVDQVLVTQLEATLPDRRAPPADGGILGKGPQGRARRHEPRWRSSASFSTNPSPMRNSFSTRNPSACCAPRSSCRRKSARLSSIRWTKARSSNSRSKPCSAPSPAPTATSRATSR